MAALHELHRGIGLVHIIKGDPQGDGSRSESYSHAATAKYVPQMHGRRLVAQLPAQITARSPHPPRSIIRPLASSLKHQLAIFAARCFSSGISRLFLGQDPLP